MAFNLDKPGLKSHPLQLSSYESSDKLLKFFICKIEIIVIYPIGLLGRKNERIM